MNDRITHLYFKLLRELRHRLNEADLLFVRMSELIVISLNEPLFTAEQKKELRELDATYRTLIGKILFGVSKIYPNRIDMFPVDSQADLVAGMEARHAQFEELERIVDGLWVAAGHASPKQDVNAQTQWGGILDNIDCKAEFERSLCAEGERRKRPNVLVARDTVYEKPSLIQTVLGDVIPKDEINNSRLSQVDCDLALYKKSSQNDNRGMTIKPNILVCGNHGAGKTSLIQAVTCPGIVPDSAISNGAVATEGFHVYETTIANFIDATGMNLGSQSVDAYADVILDKLLARLNSNAQKQLIHTIWYCIDGSGAQIQATDAHMIQAFSDKVLLVVTKCELMRQEQTEALMNSLLELLGRDRIVMVSAENKTGLGQLIVKTQRLSAAVMAGAAAELKSFHDRWDEHYKAMRRVWAGNVRADAEHYLTWATRRAAALAMIPLPVVDVAPLIANAVSMIYKLAGVYGIAVDNTVVTMLLGCAGGSLVGKIGANLLPVLKVPIATGVTYGVGQATKAYFASDLTLDLDSLKEIFLAGECEARKRNWKAIDE